MTITKINVTTLDENGVKQTETREHDSDPPKASTARNYYRARDVKEIDDFYTRVDSGELKPGTTEYLEAEKAMGRALLIFLNRRRN